MFETLCSYPVLSEVFRRVRRGKAFSPSVRAFGARLHENLAAIRLASRGGWCLKLDIRHYFDSIDHGVLMEMLRRKLADGRFRALLQARLRALYAWQAHFPVKVLCRLVSDAAAGK